MRRKKKTFRKKGGNRVRMVWVVAALVSLWAVKEQYDVAQSIPASSGGTSVSKTAVSSKKKNTAGGAVQKGAVLEGKAVHIPDGDTFDLLTAAQKKFRVRMSGIDAPEKAQDFGQVAKNGLGSLLEGKQLRVVVRDIDRYGRAVCDVYAAAALGEDWINLQMVQKGWAWHYKQYSKDAQLAAAEQAARSTHKGLWTQSNPTPPWTFRADKRRP